MTSGIYAILNIWNEKVYIGSAVYFKKAAAERLKGNTFNNGRKQTDAHRLAISKGITKMHHARKMASQ